MVNFSLENKIALITGASRGIGEAIALTLAEYGAHCILVSRKQDSLQAVKDKIEQKGVTIFIDPAAVMFLIGSEMDWQQDKFSSSFTFNNPNETARCGCGESFTVG